MFTALSPRLKHNLEFLRAISRTVRVPEIRASVQAVVPRCVMITFTISAVDIASLKDDHV